MKTVKAPPRRIPVVAWTSPLLHKVIRLVLRRSKMIRREHESLLDVVLCVGELVDGTRCIVSLPFEQIVNQGHRAIICQLARRDQVNASQLGVFQAITVINPKPVKGE
jgi:hypothetical protein